MTTRPRPTFKREPGSRDIQVSNLPDGHEPMIVRVSYLGDGNVGKGIALDNIIIPALLEDVMKERLPHHPEVVELARRAFHSEGDLEFDEGALVSEPDENGAYVACWKWIDFAGTKFDKEAE